MFGSQKRRIFKAVQGELSRARRFGYQSGVLLVEVAETTPRGIHKFLPGVTVGVHHLKSLLRRCDTVIKTRLRRYTVILPHRVAGESAEVVRDRIQETSRLREWGSVNLGIAIFPDDGLNAGDLLQAAEADLAVRVELTPEQLEKEEELFPA